MLTGYGFAGALSIISIFVSVEAKKRYSGKFLVCVGVGVGV
jgi:hypothetical protein